MLGGSSFSGGIGLLYVFLVTLLDFRLCEWSAAGFPLTGMCEERDAEFSLSES